MPCLMLCSIAFVISHINYKKTYLSITIYIIRLNRKSPLDPATVFCYWYVKYMKCLSSCSDFPVRGCNNFLTSWRWMSRVQTLTWCPKLSVVWYWQTRSTVNWFIYCIYFILKIKINAWLLIILNSMNSRGEHALMDLVIYMIETQFIPKAKLFVLCAFFYFISRMILRSNELSDWINKSIISNTKCDCNVVNLTWY